MPLLLAVAVLVLVQLGAMWLQAPAASLATAARVEAVDAIGITVSDVDRAVEFYSRVLTFEKVGGTTLVGPEWNALFNLRDVRARTVMMKLGDERIELIAFGTRGRAIPKDSRSNDRWFQHIAIIERHGGGAPLADAPQGPGDLAGAAAVTRMEPQRGRDSRVLLPRPRRASARDPRPPDKGDPRWHRTHRLFLGIDHTAIAVADTERSLRFYRDVLGMGLKGESLNHGPEQEQLNDVPGARLRITSVQARAGPAVEFLEYLEPKGGRPIPSDMRPNDLAAWRIIGTVASGSGRGQSLVRDPDGHLVHFRPR